MDWQEHIEINADVVAGKPVVRGTRVPVELVLELMSGGWTEAQLLENYPTLTREGVRAALAYATEIIRDEQVLSLGRP